MKLFTVGPVEMYPETLEESARQLPYFRTAEFSEIMLQSERMLLELAGASQGSRAVFLTASGTGAMEAAVINCLDQTDFVLTVDGGSFGHRFAQICQRHGITQEILHLEFGETLSEQMLEASYRDGMTALLVNLDETSIGQLYDIKIISAFCKRHHLLLVVDAISAFLSDEVLMDQYGIDILILSSQKAFALAPGISAAILSPKAIELVQQRGTDLMYFDFREYLRDGERGQTPFTPAVGILLTLHTRLERLVAAGREQVRASIRGIALDFRKKVSALPIEIPAYPLSNAVTPLYFPQGNARKIYESLRRDYDITITPTGGALSDYLLRVGHIGNLTVEDNDRLIRAMKEILEMPS